MSDRAVINHENRIKQVHSFEGMVLHRNISPTDIDMAIDLNGNAFVLAEGKKDGVSVSTGQKHLLKNICSALNRPCIAVIYRHNTPVGEKVIVRECMVDEIYWNGRWRKPQKEETTVKEQIESFLKYLKKKGVKI